MKRLATIQSMHAVSASTSAGSTAGNMPTRNWLRPSLRYGSTSTIPFARSVFAIARGVHVIGEVDRADDQRPLEPGRRRTATRTADFSAHCVEMRGRRGRPRHAEVQPAAGEHPVDLVGQQQQGRQRRRVVRLVLPGVLDRGPPATATRAASGRSPRTVRRSARSRPGSARREPQPAVRAERLLRREVVGVRLADVDGQAAGAGRRVDEDERVLGRRRDAGSAS